MKKIGDNNDLKVLCERYKNTRFHISSDPIRKLRNVKQKKIIWFPNGLWFGIGCAWLDFMINELEKDPCYYIYQVIANNEMKKIKSMEEMTKFDDEIIDGHKVQKDEWKIDWKTVAKKYDGIEIDVTKDKFYEDSNYYSQNQWFWTWDIPSGAIWKFNDVIIRLIFQKKDNIWYQVNDVIPYVRYQFTKK
uniref:Uncharacterized protein n=1 Tax=viral metagenome TaxID=1070528 RepID=A0A6C0C5U4_9ZZZZ